MNTGRILLAAAKSQDRSRLMCLLEESSVGNQITIANDGRETLDYVLGTGRQAKSGALNPALVLLDSTLRRPDSFQVLAQIRNSEATRYLPVVMLLSSSREDELSKCYAMGASECVIKATNDITLMDRMELLCGFWMQIDQILGGTRTRMDDDAAKRETLINLLALARQVASGLERKPILESIDLTLHLTHAREMDRPKPN